MNQELGRISTKRVDPGAIWSICFSKSVVAVGSVLTVEVWIGPTAAFVPVGVGDSKGMAVAVLVEGIEIVGGKIK